jgi:glyoxylase-like metal-dependent hydrolase (beta-lactamase superfamily II)
MKNVMTPTFLRSFVILLCLANPLSAEIKTQQISDNVFALVGALGNRAPGNLGNNATFGVIVTSDGVVLIDAGATYRGAAKIDQAIRRITDQPVRIVINTGGQDHRWLGNSYWFEQGARIIASEAAIADQRDRLSVQFTGLATLVGAYGLDGTEAMTATETFTDQMVVTLGDTTLALFHKGGAHTQGDSYVWLEQQSVVFTGDIVYTQRILGVLSFSNSQTWLTAFEAIAALDPDHVVPGHGDATDMLTATADTYDYLTNLREGMAEHIDAGGDIIGAAKVDQSAFAYLQNFDQLAGRNAQAVFEAMEWE